MFPFSVHKYATTSPVYATEWQDNGSIYEVVTFDDEKINVFAAQVNYCEPHWHLAAELIYVLSGAFSVTINHETVTLKSGGLIYINSDQLHSLVTLENDSRLLTIQFSPNLFTQEGDKSMIRYVVHSKTDYCAEDFAIRSTLLSLIERMIISDENADESAMYYKYSMIYQLIAQLMASGKIRGEWPQESVREKDEQLIKESIEYIHAHFESEMRLSSIALKMGVSYSYFSKLFKRISGYNFKEYVDIVRINKVKFLLKNTMIPITDISHRCGFTEHKQLISTFKRYCFTTPTAFRKHHLAENQSEDIKQTMESFRCLPLSSVFDAPIS